MFILACKNETLNSYTLCTRQISTYIRSRFDCMDCNIFGKTVRRTLSHFVLCHYARTVFFSQCRLSSLRRILKNIMLRLILNITFETNVETTIRVQSQEVYFPFRIRIPLCNVRTGTRYYGATASVVSASKT
jgi:hypothetical protein